MTRERILLRPQRIWTAGESLTSSDILVEGDRIAAIGVREAPENANVVALPRLTLFPD